MKKFQNIDEILDFAINAEQEAVDFYTDLAENANNKEMEKIFKQFAKEEMGHKSRIMNIKETGSYKAPKEEISDLQIADYTVDIVPTSDMRYDEALVVAMKKEKAAFRLYNDLANRAHNDEMKELFLSLAQEESKHKLRFELEYDEYVMREN
ncbi:MAG: ferritin family protein [Bacteroidales bacterium]|nr:ferritin family protein [Bacteroidales bacterium]